MPFVVIDSVKYHYDVVIPPEEVVRGYVLFVHGAGGSHRHWQGVLPLVGKEYMAIAVDLPGHGASGGQASDTIEKYSAFIYRLAETVIGSPFILAGHSMGGAIAMDFALKWPQWLKGLVLVGTGCRLRVLPALLETFARGEKFFNLLPLAYGPKAAPELLKAAKEEMENVAAEVYYADFAACNRFDICEHLAKIDTPTLVISARDDRLTPPKYGEFLHRNIPNAQYRLVDDCGHMMMLEKADEIGEIILSFCRGL